MSRSAGGTEVPWLRANAVRLVFAVLGGALYGLPFLEPAMAPAAFIGLAPLLVVLCSRSCPLGLAASVTIAAAGIGAATVLTALPLVRISPLAVLVQGSFKIGWPLSGTLLFLWLERRTRWPLVLLWPCAWVFTEWAWSYYSLGVAFGLSGYTMFRYPRLIQVADLTGVLGVSFLVQAVVGGLADAALALTAAAGPRRALMPPAAALALVVVALGYGSVRLAWAHALPGPRIALVQPAVLHGLGPEQQQLVQMKQVGLARTRIKPGEVDLVVFPENAVRQIIDETPYLRDFQELSGKLRAPLLVGLTTHTDENALRLRHGLPPLPVHIGRRSYRPAHNSAALITPAGIVSKYDKRHLLPFSEKVPAERFFEAIGLLDQYQAFVTGRLGYMGEAVPGTSTRLLTVPGTDYPPYWTPVCFEQADARLAREASLLGARSFINITSEGDLGPQIYWNTAAVAVLRAAELHVGFARCGNMGITGIIDPWGRQTHHLRGERGPLWGEPGVLKARLPLGPPSPTIYARLGDWPAGVAALVLAVAAAASFRRRRMAAS
jgi:apolipoprotein N-acyltransferase